MPKTRVGQCKAVCKTFRQWIAPPRTRCANTSRHSVNVLVRLILFWAELLVRPAGDPGIAPGNEGRGEIPTPLVPNCVEFSFTRLLAQKVSWQTAEVFVCSASFLFSNGRLCPQFWYRAYR